MHRLLAAVLGLGGFLAVSAYWIVEIASARPHPGLDGILTRALLAAVACYLAGRFVGRLAIALFEEACEEARAREGPDESDASGDETGTKSAA